MNIVAVGICLIAGVAIAVYFASRSRRRHPELNRHPEGGLQIFRADSEAKAVSESLKNSKTEAVPPKPAEPQATGFDVGISEVETSDEEMAAGEAAPSGSASSADLKSGPVIKTEHSLEQLTPLSEGQESSVSSVQLVEQVETRKNATKALATQSGIEIVDSSETRGEVHTISSEYCPHEPTSLEPRVPVEPSPPIPEAGEEGSVLSHIGHAQEIGEGEKGPAGPGGEGCQRVKGNNARQKRDPVDRGGRHRGVTTQGPGEQRRKSTPPVLKPEIVCWKREQEWILGVELPSSFEEVGEVSVAQEGVSLAEDQRERGIWRLANLRGGVIVRAPDADPKISSSEVSLGDEDFQVFKLSARNLNEGRRVKRASRGSYLVVAPVGWSRDEELAGPPPSSPEPVFLDGYLAHFFDLSSSCGSKIAFRDAPGRLIEIGSAEPRFQLDGKQMLDGSEYLWPLFVCSPPVIRLVGGSWGNVGTIVLGEEGQGRGKWRTQFKPAASRPEQAMPTAVMERKAGWYFVRFYDLQDDLMDSLDFRFAAGLREIKIKHPGPLPEQNGHKAATVEFEHSADWHIQPASAGNIKIERSPGRTILVVPPAPDCDRSEWLVGPQEGPAIKVVVLVERVWWAVDNEKHLPSLWEDNLLRLAREQFQATSADALWLRLPKCRWTERVFVGFGPETRRSYQVKVSENVVAIPLRDFCDSPELENRTQNRFLRVDVNGEGREATVAIVQAESPGRELDFDRIPASRVACLLTKLCRLTSGPLRQLLREARRQYRRPRHSSADRNDEFVRRGLCTIALFLQVAEARKFSVPRSARRRKVAAQHAAQRFPETMRDVWSRYSNLGGF